MSALLAGVRVLDLSRVLAGPWATQLLADFGADVIKVEHPDGGDDTRSWGPPYVQAADGSRESAYFLAANRGKRSICVDLGAEEGRRIVRELAAGSDVLIENFKVGALARRGLDYESVRAVRADIVYCSLTGFGQEGPYAARPGYDFLVQGMSGLMSLTGEPGGRPLKVGVALADVITGLYACSAILAALQHRQRTGVGQHIDVSLFDSMVAALANQALSYLVSGNNPRPLGNAHPSIVPYDAFPTADGDIIIAVGNDAQFRRLCEVIGRAELVRDSRFLTNDARVRNRDALTALLSDALKQKPGAHWLAGLAAADVPSGPINTLAAMFADPHVLHRNLRLDLPHPAFGSVPSVAAPVRFSETGVHYERAPPQLGADTRVVLKDRLGRSDAEIDMLARAGVILCGDCHAPVRPV